MTSLESTTPDAYSKEDEVTKRKLKFLIHMVELAEKDAEWNVQLKDMVQAFGEVEQ